MINPWFCQRFCDSFRRNQLLDLSPDQIGWEWRKLESKQKMDPEFVMYQSPTTNQPNQLNGYSSVPVYPVYGEVPVDVCCPYCQTRVFTVTTKEDGNLTYFSASLLCFMGCWLGCCLIPFCIDSCKDVIHTCPNCRAPIGKFNRLC